MQQHWDMAIAISAKVVAPCGEWRVQHTTLIAAHEQHSLIASIPLIFQPR